MFPQFGPTLVDIANIYQNRRLGRVSENRGALVARKFLYTVCSGSVGSSGHRTKLFASGTPHCGSGVARLWTAGPVTWPGLQTPTPRQPSIAGAARNCDRFANTSDVVWDGAISGPIGTDDAIVVVLGPCREERAKDGATWHKNQTAFVRQVTKTWSPLVACSPWASSAPPHSILPLSSPPGFVLRTTWVLPTAPRALLPPSRCSNA